MELGWLGLNPYYLIISYATLLAVCKSHKLFCDLICKKEHIASAYFLKFLWRLNEDQAYKSSSQHSAWQTVSVHTYAWYSILQARKEESDQGTQSHDGAPCGFYFRLLLSCTSLCRGAAQESTAEITTWSCKWIRKNQRAAFVYQSQHCYCLQRIREGHLGSPVVKLYN